MAEVLQALNKQQPGAGHPPCLTQSTPPGEAEYFKGSSLMKNIQESVKRSKVRNSLVSQPPTPITPASLISTIKVGILCPPKVLADDLTKATLREGSPNILKVTPEFMGWKTTKESTRSCDANCLSRQKENMASFSKQGVSATCSSVPGSSGNAASGSGHGPGGSKQEVPTLLLWSLMMMTSLIIPIRSYLWRKSSQSHHFPEMISRDLMRGIFFRQR